MTELIEKLLKADRQELRALEAEIDEYFKSRLTGWPDDLVPRDRIPSDSWNAFPFRERDNRPLDASWDDARILQY